MNGAKAARYSMLARVYEAQLEVLHSGIDWRKEQEKKEGEEADDDVMQKHCTAIAEDGSRTFSF